MFSNWKGGVDFFDEQEKRMEDDYGIESGDGDEDDDSDDGWDDYVEDSDPYSDEF
jgi:hypothetical protein